MKKSGKKLGPLFANLDYEMEVSMSAPLLKRIKSWQLFWLGITGWVTLYSVAIISWGASGFIIGNSQGGCFASAMTLASFETRRFHKRGFAAVDPLPWTNGITTEQLNLALAQSLKKQELLLEGLHPYEAGLGFGLRAVKSGRTLVFETARWKEPIIDLRHVQTTEENRNNVRADIAIIVGAGTADEETRMFVNAHPLKLLVGRELKAMFPKEKKSDKELPQPATDLKNKPNLGPARV